MVSGAEKCRRRRDAAAAAVAFQPETELVVPALVFGAQEPTEWRNLQYNGRNLDIPYRTFSERPPAALPVGSEMYRTRSFVVEQGVDMMTQECPEQLRKDWEVAKARVGEKKAGKTLEEFMCMNTKLIPLDPRDHTPNKSPIFATGSSGPLTMDMIYVASGLAPTTKKARLIVDTQRNMAMDVLQRDMIFRKGEWIVWGMPPVPKEGRKLESWEQVCGITARYETPFMRETRVL